MENQTYLFGIFILNGFLIGLIFDIFRILRKSFKTNDFITYIQDILFWVLTTIIILYSIFKFSNGDLRAFIFVGITIGIAIYMLLFSNSFIKINLYIINFAKIIINFIIVKPTVFISKIIKKIIFKPTTFFFINIRKFLSVFKINIKNLFNKKKKHECRKDFV